MYNYRTLEVKILHKVKNKRAHVLRKHSTKNNNRIFFIYKYVITKKKIRIRKELEFFFKNN